ncbi:MAG TPA: pyruvate dehydrogenase complex E1 component subunit beta [Acidimicrobiia bacterium]|nr:pyruvate dehydrogenase complex E1 component subunit beta [Acidimicrobiia bacterium]
MFSDADLLDLHRRMSVIRAFEERVAALYRDGEVPGFVHLSIGQEAAAVGACWPLLPADVITSTHRGHGHCLAKGLDPRPMFAELMAKADGTNRGRGGSMHIADPTLGIFGANGIVGAGLPIAVGAATAGTLRQDGTVAVAFFGDGAVAHGTFHEAVNLAAVWQLPVIFFCENNGYSEFSPASTQHAAPLEQRAAGYGVEFVVVDGNDVVATAGAMTDIVEATRAGRGPTIVEAATYRWHGHYEGDPQRYRSTEEVEQWAERDPLVVHARRVRAAGISDEVLTKLEAEVARELDDAVEAARGLTAPAADTLHDFVVRPRPERPEPPPPPVEAPVFRTMDAIHDALEAELAGDDRVFVAGIDVAAGGNVFGLTRGLHGRFGDRVRDTPISESAIVGLGVGAAMAGMRPVVELMYLDFLGVCLDQLLNQAAKLPFMTGGAAQMGLTVRTQFGAGRSSGSQHSQSLEVLLAHIPGLSVVMPSTPADTYGLLRAAIQDPNPVVFIENRLLYGMKGPQPSADHLVPIGKSIVVRPGDDITVVTVSRMVHEALAAAEHLADEGISVEVIDLRTVAPLDMAPVLESVHRTSRLLIAHEAVVPFGIGAEVAATVAREGFWDLDAPVQRVGAAATPPPYAPDLERAWLPGRDDIAEAVRRLAHV